MLHRPPANAAFAEFAQNRATMEQAMEQAKEQAKEMLVVVYAITADAAFDLLKWRSQEGDLKLRLMAEQVVIDFVSLAKSGQTPARSAYDNLLLTAEQRAKVTP